MRTASSMPWYGWAVLAYLLLNVVLRLDVGIVLPIIIGVAVAAMTGSQRGPLTRGQRPAQPRRQQPLPPIQPPTQPSDTPASDWATASGPTTAPETGMPRIEVPQYPQSPAAGTPYPSGPSSPSTDPTVSLGQLHLARCARDLHAAATAGSTEDVRRVLRETGEQVDRLLTQLAGAGALAGSGRQEFGAGLRRLQRDLSAADGEEPAGPRVARVVRAAASMGQTGRYE